MLSKQAVQSLKNTKRRATEKILQRLGQSSETQDEEDYQDLHGEFSETHGQVVLLLSKLQLYVDAMERWQRCGEALTAALGDFAQRGADDESEAHAALGSLHGALAEAQREISELSGDMSDAWSRQVLDPLRDVAFRYNAGISKCVRQRASDKVDFDAYRRRAKSASEGSRVTQAQRNFTKLAATQDRFEANSAFLLGEFRRMRASRSELVLQEVALAARLQMDLAQGMHQALARNMGPALHAHEAALEAPAPPGAPRRNAWLSAGPAQTYELVGYDGDELGAKTPSDEQPANGASSEAATGADGASAPPAPLGRSTSARHYVRNAPRAKPGGVKLKNIGKQLSLSNLGDKRKKAGPAKVFVLPAATDGRAPQSEAAEEEAPQARPPTPASAASAAVAESNDAAVADSDGEEAKSASFGPSAFRDAAARPLQPSPSPHEALESVDEESADDDDAAAAAVAPSTENDHVSQDEDEGNEEGPETIRRINSERTVHASGSDDDSDDDGDDDDVGGPAAAAPSDGKTIVQVMRVDNALTEATERQAVLGMGDASDVTSNPPAA